jgi:hypothetical protein
MQWLISGEFSPITYSSNVICRCCNLSVASVFGLAAAKRHNRYGKSQQYLLTREVVKKMINRLLVEKQMPIKRLAKALAVSISDVESLGCSEEAYLQLIGKINLPLIRLYCQTKWKNKKR